MSTSTIDYDALAKQYGATSSSGQSATGVDYDALAKAHGATSSTALTHEDRGILSKAWDVLTNSAKRDEFLQHMQPQASDDAGTQFAKGAGRMLTSVATVPYDLLKPAQTADEAQGSTVGMIATRAKNMIVQPMQQLNAEGQKDVAQGRPVRGYAKGIASSLPIVGPMATDMIKRAADDPLGVLGEAAMMKTIPEAKEDVATAAGGALKAADKLNPRGILAGKMSDVMAEVPNAPPVTRGDVVNAATSHGVNLDLADASGNAMAKGTKTVVQRTIGGSGTFEKNTAANLQALDEWGNKVLRDTSPTELNREQTGNLVKKNLLDQQSNMYDQAGQYFKQVDDTLGSAKPDVTSVRQIAREIVNDNAGYYEKHPELKPGQAWKTVQALAGTDGEALTADGMTWKEFYQAKMPAARKAAGSTTEALKLIGQQWKDLGGESGTMAKPVTYTWSDLQKLRSDLMKEVQSPEIVGSRSEGWLKHLEGAISESMDQSAGKLSPLNQELYQRANGIWQSMKGTYDNPQHPFYHIVRALNGTTAGDSAAALKPEFVRQLRDAMGNDFSAYQRDAVGRILNPKNSSAGFDFKNMNSRLSRTDIEKLSAVLSPEQMRELQLLNKTGSVVTGNVNPSGTSDVMVKGGDLANIVHNPPLGVATVAGEYGTARTMTNPRVTDFLTRPAKDAAKMKATDLFKSK